MSHNYFPSGGHRLTSLARAAVFVLALVASLFIVAGLASAQTGPELTLHFDQGLVAVGQGFAPGERVTLRVVATATEPQSFVATAEAQGRFRVPTGVVGLPGTTIRVEARRTSGATLETTILSTGGADATPVAPAGTSWVRQFGTATDDAVQRLAVDGAGNAHAVGILADQVGTGDAFVRKLGPDGAELWTRRLGGSRYDAANGVAVDGEGAVYVAGFVADPLPGQTSAGTTDAFLRKYGPDGAERWTRQFGTAGVDGAHGVAVDRAGNAYVVAAMSGSHSILRSYGPDGAERWTSRFGTGSDDVNAVAVDPSGNAYVVGLTGGERGGDVVVRAYTPDGAERWSRQFGTPGYDAATDVAVDGTGRVFVVGTAAGALAGQSMTGGNADAFVQAYDASGRELWLRQFGTSGDETARAVAVEPGGHVFVVGLTTGDLGGRRPIGLSDAFVRGYVPDGRELWTELFGTPHVDVANAAAADRSGLLVVGGLTRGALPGQTQLGGDDAFVLRMSPPPMTSPTGTAPPLRHDERYFAQTGYRIDHDVVWDYFVHRGGVETFGYPVSRTFTFRGRPVQLFQRRLIEVGPGGAPRQANLLDDELMPYTRLNGASFPVPDPRLIAAAPPPTNALATLQFVQAHAVNVWQNRSANFLLTFLNTVTYQTAFPRGGADPNLLPGIQLEMWGVPTSPPALDPNNHNFVYQRWQRGIMHYDVTTGRTQGILLGDYFKAILTGENLPADLEAQARGNRFYRQYDPTQPGWVRAPELLAPTAWPTDLTHAFTPG